MGNKKYISTFDSIDRLLYKITELTTQGYKESNMYAVTNMEDTISMLRGRAGAELRGVDAENWLNRFKLILNGEEPILDAFARMGFSELQSLQFYFIC